MAGRRQAWFDDLVDILDEGAGALGIGIAFLFSPLLRGWYLNWGTAPGEAVRPLPGDDLIHNPKSITTRAVTIHAPVEFVWPWIVQLGYGRGGLYSYERLERLVGCEMQNAGSILPEMQDLNVGDWIVLDPRIPAPYKVVAIAHQRVLVMRPDAVPFEQSTSAAQAAPDSNWVFYLEPVDERTTRLFVRSRLYYPPGLAQTLMWRVITEPVSFIMERKMMLGIRSRAEAAYAKSQIEEVVDAGRTRT